MVENDSNTKPCGCPVSFGNYQVATGPLEGEEYRCLLCGQVQ